MAKNCGGPQVIGHMDVLRTCFLHGVPNSLQTSRSLTPTRAVARNAVGTDIRNTSTFPQRFHLEVATDHTNHLKMAREVDHFRLL